MKQELSEGEDYNINDKGLFILTAKYLLERGYCCGRDAHTALINYEAVPEPKRSQLLEKKNSLK